MRILIASPPKMGNTWLKHLLGSIYNLELLKKARLKSKKRLEKEEDETREHAAPERPDLAIFKEWVERGEFPDGTIFHQHYAYSEELYDVAAAVPAHLVSIIRDPYDAFVSFYYNLQVKPRARAERQVKRVERAPFLIGKPLDHPDVLAFLDRGGYRRHLVMANGWLHSGRSVVVRYEDLWHDPMGALTRVTDQLAPVAPERIARAIEECSAENMRRRRPALSKNIRVARVGDSRERLNEAHLAIFRERYADLIRSLGYAVR